MRSTLRTASLLLASALACATANADITIGVSVSLAGGGVGVGIPVQNAVKLFPASIAGEKLKIIMLDDGTDSTKAVQNARRFVSEDNVDLVIGSSANSAAIAMSEGLAQAQTVQLFNSPAVLPPSSEPWGFRLTQPTKVMVAVLLKHMRIKGVKTVGFLGYTDTYGEDWLKVFQVEAARVAPDIKLVGIERFARADSNVNAQVLKLNALRPDAILVVAVGSGAAMPHKALVERGYAGKIYQSPGAATRDLIRLGGKDVEGGYVLSGPAVVPELLPADFPSKAQGMKFVQQYEQAYGQGSRNQFAASVNDMAIVLERAIPEALKVARPGTREFRVALRDALDNMGRLVVSQGVVNFSKSDHWGFTPESAVVLRISNGDWALEPIESARR